MGTSKVDFRGQSFWTRDAAVSVLLALLVAELDPVTPSDPELDALLDRWALNAALCVTGAVDAALDDYVTNDHIVELIHAAIPLIQDRLVGDALVEVTDPAFLRRATAVGVDPPFEASAPDFTYFLEVDLAKEVIRVWSAGRQTSSLSHVIRRKCVAELLADHRDQRRHRTVVRKEPGP